MKNTQDLADFGYREMKEAATLLQSYVNCDITQLAADVFVDEGVRLEFNPDSGYVFLVNDEMQVLMMNHDMAGYEIPLLDLWLYTPHDGVEGFAEDLVDLYLSNDLSGDDQVYLLDVLDDAEQYRKEQMGVVE